MTTDALVLNATTPWPVESIKVPTLKNYVMVGLPNATDIAPLHLVLLVSNTSVVEVLLQNLLKPTLIAYVYSLLNSYHTTKLFFSSN